MVPSSVGSNPTLVRAFLCPCVGPIPILGLIPDGIIGYKSFTVVLGLTRTWNHEWKKFSTDPDLQWKYTVAVKNRYHVLSDEGNGVKYEKFVKANYQAMEECLPKKTNARKSLRSSNAQVVSARQEAHAARSLRMHQHRGR